MQKSFPAPLQKSLKHFLVVFLKEMHGRLCIVDDGRFSSRSEVENDPYGFVRSCLCIADGGGSKPPPYGFVRCRLCVGDYGRSRTPVPTDLCVAGLCVSPPNGEAFRIHCRGRPLDAPFVCFTAERCGDTLCMPCLFVQGFLRGLRGNFCCPHPRKRV